ncbi:MAG: tetratricopeptide repeat protein [Bacteroidetes bacterium]|nr:tetratricopeptide repeat protein [Bacteroidota bacterium]
MKRVVLISGLLFFCTFIFAIDNQAIISQANKAYADGLYNNALDLYKQVLKSGYESADLYYNIGNTSYKMNDFTSAILYYEKAIKHDPGNPDYTFNLKVANGKIADKIEPIPELFYKRWYHSLVTQCSADVWAKVGVGIFILSLVCAAFYFISRVLFIRKTGFWLGITLFVLSFFSFLFAYQNYQVIQSQDEAIIFTPTVTIKSSPDDKSIDLFVLHEGTKVQLIDQIGIWYEIRIANGSVGWLPLSTLERI